MKMLFFLLFPLITLAQNDSIANKSISVISAEKMNVVYSGIDNPMKIAVPGAVSYSVSASSGYIDKTGENTYTLIISPVKETIISIDAIMQDGSILHEEKEFRVLGIPRADLKIGDRIFSSYYLPMTRKELCRSKIDVFLENFLFDVNPSDFFTVTQFNIIIPLKGKNETYTIDGDAIPKNIQELIMKVKDGGIILITEIKGHCNFRIDVIPAGVIEIISGD